MKLVKFIFALITSLILLGHSQCYAVEWEARWIWSPQKYSLPNSWAALRTEVEIANVSQDATAYISADSKYWLWINGEMVVFEGSYTGGPTPVRPAPRVDYYPIASNKYYDEVDIRKYLKRGKNTIAALAWYYGDDGHKGSHISSHNAGFIFQANIGDQVIISDDSWKAKAHDAYLPVEKKARIRIPAWSVNYDASKGLGDWTDQAWYLPGYDDSDWPQAKTYRHPPKAPFFELFPSEIPPLKNYGLANCTNYPESAFPFVSDGETIKCHLDFNKNFTPYLDVEAGEGLDIHVKTNMTRNTIEAFYKTKTGRQKFESYSWMNGRIIEYNIPKGVTVHGLKYRWTGVGDIKGHFESDDEWYTRIWQMAENTLYICARDNFMDTPDRERGLWIGDVADQASYLFYSMDEAGRNLLKKSIIVTMAFSDSETGIFAGLAPGRFRELPAQSLQFIDQGVWHYYFNTGDKETLEYAYPYVHRYLSIWKKQDNGLVVLRNGAWNWTDWGPQDTIDYAAIQNALYYNALVATRKMALALGDKTHMDFYDQRIKELRRAYRKHFWQDGFFSSDPKNLKDDRANAIAILFGLAEPEEFDDIVDNVLIPNQFASPHFEWMVYNAMAEAGRYKDALKRMRQRYGVQVDNPKLSTLAEKFPTGGTENHAWNAPSTILSQHIAGIEPTSVGWKSFQVMPNMAHMKYVKQLVPSVQGDIHFEMKRNADEVSMSLVSPEDTITTIGIPRNYFDVSEVKVNGRIIWKNGKTIEPKFRTRRTVKHVGSDEKYLKFNVPAGDWEFTATP